MFLRRVFGKHLKINYFSDIPTHRSWVFSTILDSKIIDMVDPGKIVKNMLNNHQSSDAVKLIQELHKYNKLDLPTELLEDIDIEKVYKIIDIDQLCTEKILNTIIKRPTLLFEVVEYLLMKKRNIPLETVILIGNEYYKSNPIFVDRILSKHPLNSYSDKGRLFYLNFYSMYNQVDKVMPYISLLNPFKSEYFNAVYSLLRIDNNLMKGYEFYQQIKDENCLLRNASIGVLDCLNDLKKADELAEFVKRCIENYQELDTKARIHLFQSINYTPEIINELLKKSSSEEVFHLMNYLYRNRRELIRKIKTDSKEYAYEYYCYVNPKENLNSKLIKKMDGLIGKAVADGDRDIILIPNLVLEMFNKYNSSKLYDKSLDLSMFYSKLKYNDADVVISMIKYYSDKSDRENANKLISNYENSHEPISYKFSCIYEMSKCTIGK